MSVETSKSSSPPDKRTPDVKVLANGKVMKVQKTRQRKILSCIYCHSKKIKCSRQMPTCNNCEKLGFDCQYFVNDRILKGGKQRSGSPPTPTINGLTGLTEKSLTPDLPNHFTVSRYPPNMNGGTGTESENELHSLSSSEPNNNSHHPSLSHPQMTDHHPSLSTPTPQIPDHQFPNHRIANSQLPPGGQANISNLGTHGSHVSNGHLAHELSGQESKLHESFSPNFPTFPKSMLQTPVINNSNNNASSNFFHSNSGLTSHQDFATPQDKEDQYSFNLSSFTFASFPNNASNSNSNNLNTTTTTTTATTNSNNNNNNPQNFSKFLSSEIHSNVPSHNNSSTNISSLFAKNPGQIYPQNSVQNFMDQLNSKNNSSHTNLPANLSGSNVPRIDSTSNFLTQSHPVSHHPATDIPVLATPSPQSQFQSHLLAHIPNTSNNNNTFGPGNHGNSNGASVLPHGFPSASFEDSSRLDNTKNFLNGTNNYYDNENLLEDLEKLLPNSKEKSFELVDRYINSVHILLPVITNIDDFLDEHQKFWNECNPYDKQSNNTLTDFNCLQFYTLYFPILYASTISEFEEYDNLLLNQDINKYLNGFNKICQYYNYPHGLKIIPLLLGNVIIQSTSPNPSTMEISQIIRYAKFLEMNKDPVLTLKIKNFEIIKFRRLLWWVIFGLDCLTSHNFCLPPVCRFEDFNVLLPNEEEPKFSELTNEINEYELNISMLSLNIKFKYDRILNELVYQLHNDTSKNISIDKMNEIKRMIVEYFEYIHLSINKMNLYHKRFPPQTVNEINLVNFIKNHSWSFVDRALMLLHKKFLLSEHAGLVTSNSKSNPFMKNIPNGNGLGNEGDDDEEDEEEDKTGLLFKFDNRHEPREQGALSKQKEKEQERDEDHRLRTRSSYSVHLTKPRNGKLSFNEYEDTFQGLLEANLINNMLNYKNLNINLEFNKFKNFNYNDMNNNLIPSILHNLNDFLKYNDFLKFGKFNWYVKRTIPLDSIILLFMILIIKFKTEVIKFNELIIIVKLINKSLFILNRKWFKTEKYKRMLSLTNLTWEYIIKKFNILQIINKFTNSNFSIISSGKNKIFNKYEYFNYQLTGYVNTTELFKTMQVAQPVLSIELINILNDQKSKYLTSSASSTVSPTPNLENSAINSNTINYIFNSSSSSPMPPNKMDESFKPGLEANGAVKDSSSDNANTDTKDYNSANSTRNGFDLHEEIDENQTLNSKYDINLIEHNDDFKLDNDFNISLQLVNEFECDNQELHLLKEKIVFDLKNNYVDINDYCAFYISLENILHELIAGID